MELFELSETLVIVLKRTLCWLEKYLQDISNNASPYKCEEILTAQASSLSIWCFAQSVAASAFTFWRIFTQNSSSDLSNGGSVSFFRDSCSMSSSRCAWTRLKEQRLAIQDIPQVSPVVNYAKQFVIQAKFNLLTGNQRIIFSPLKSINYASLFCLSLLFSTFYIISNY